MNMMVMDKRRALIICNGTFDDPMLPAIPGATRDHEALTRMFGGPSAGFEVTPLLDAGFLEVRKAIARICRESTAQDTLLIYYSGGSFRGADDSLYLPVRDSTREYAESTTVETDFILRHLRLGRCRKIVLIVDGCHAGAFFVNNRGIPDGLCAIMACGADERIPDTPEGGVFTRALINALESPRTDRDGDGRISIDEVYDAVKESFAADGAHYTPQKWVWNLRDPIYIASSPQRVFLSYAREDIALATTIKQELEQRGFGVWLDLEGIKAGNWLDKVTSGLGCARCVVFLMTEASLRSDQVRKELGFAADRQVPIIPITPVEWNERSLPDWYLFEYRSIHRHLVTPDTPGANIDTLAGAIREVRPGRMTDGQPYGPR